MASIDIQLTNQGKTDWPGVASFAGMPLEPGQQLPRFQTALDNSLRLDPNSANNSVPPGGTINATLLFGVDKRTTLVNLAFRVASHSCSYNGQPYMIVRTDLPAHEQTGNVPLPNAVIDASSQGDNLFIPATIERTVSDILLSEGQQVTIRHIDGQWRPGLTADWPPVGPEGDSRVPGKASFPLPNAPLMALIFGIEGSDQVYLFGGSEMTFTTPASGVLWFGPNDDDFDDNSGELTLAISLE
jgi:hypothetical protein